MPTFAPNKKNANYPFLNYPISKSQNFDNIVCWHYI